MLPKKDDIEKKQLTSLIYTTEHGKKSKEKQEGK